MLKKISSNKMHKMEENIPLIHNLSVPCSSHCHDHLNVGVQHLTVNDPLKQFRPPILCWRNLVRLVFGLFVGLATLDDALATPQPFVKLFRIKHVDPRILNRKDFSPFVLFKLCLSRFRVYVNLWPDPPFFIKFLQES